MTNTEFVSSLLDVGFRLVFWPAIGDIKGPTELGWTTKTYTLDDYQEGHRVGMMTGVALRPGHYLHDIDLDWAPGSLIAQALLPGSGFVYGRAGKRISHVAVTLPEAHPSFRYEDIDKTCLMELRGTKTNGEIGLQSMIPPSIWTPKGLPRGVDDEPLTFIKSDGPTHYEDATKVVQRICLSATGMILARHLGINGFGHESRLAWAGFLLRAGVPPEDLILMGEAISAICNNREVVDVRRAVESTATALASGNKKVKGAPALARIIGEKGKQVIARINEWLGKDSDFIRDSRGVILKDNQDNIKRALELLDVRLSYHSFSERILVGETVLDDAIMQDIWLRIDRELRFRPSFVFFEMVLKSIAREHTFHAVRDYLDHLIWDQIPRIDEWLVRYAGAPDTAYVHAVSAIMMIAAVRRVRQPGCKYDEMLVLKSTQGTLKSSALRALCPQEEWFSDDLPLNVESKQIIERTLGKWIIEASDLAGKRKAEIEQLKSMLSRQVDGPARMAYAHNPVERPRQFILVGTTNLDEFLMDSTGSRRYWPVSVIRFLVPELIRDRDQLWAEAAYREALGESIRLDELLWPDASEQQDQYHAHDAWEDVLRRVVLETVISQDGKRRVLTQHLWEGLGVLPAHRDRPGGGRIAEIMQRFGFKGTTMRVPGQTNPQRGYITVGAGKLELVGADAVEPLEAVLGRSEF